MKNQPKKVKGFRYVIRKYIVAKDIRQALRHEHKAPVNEIFVAENQDERQLATPIGFEYYVEDKTFYSEYKHKRKKRR